jgi:hypothetical protein
MPRINRATTQARDGQILAGIQKDLRDVPSLRLAGQTYTIAELTRFFEGRIEATMRVAALRAQWIAASAEYEALDVQASKMARSLRDYLVNEHGESASLLADFGFVPPRKAPPRTPEENVSRAAKAAATRAARHTMGKKQKAAIKGTV